MNKELEEARQNLIKQLENTKIANECGLATKGEFSKDIKAIETVLKELKRLQENCIEKDKIREKIEEQNKLKEKYLEMKEYGQVDIRLYKIAILEELLEGK